VNESAMTFVAWRNGGLLRLASLWIWLRLTSGWRVRWPMKGFRGVEYLLSADTVRRVCRLRSIHLRRVRSTPDAPPWRLTCELQIDPPPSLKWPSGTGSANDGSSWAIGGVGDSDHQILTTLTWDGPSTDPPVIPWWMTETALK